MLITSRTPLRVSFFGGGTDYPEYFERHPGAVVGMAIDKYVYVRRAAACELPAVQIPVAYSRVEAESRGREYPASGGACATRALPDRGSARHQHHGRSPGKQRARQFLGIHRRPDNLISSLRSEPLTKLDLGLKAIFIEREVLKERVGVQDQLHAAYGGLNRFDFVDSRIRISPVQMTSTCQRQFVSSLVLLYTALRATPPRISRSRWNRTLEKKVDRELSNLIELTSQAVRVLEGKDPDAMLREFGAMMHEAG